MALEKRWQSGDRIISYRVGGEGTPLVLLHGFAEDSTVWEQQQPLLESSCRTISINLPGSGSSTPLSDYDMENQAKCILEVLDQESIATCVLIGHSMGGYVSLAFAAQFPQRLMGLGLFSSTAYADTEEKKANRRKSIRFMEQQGVRKFLEQTDPNLFSETTKRTGPGMIEELVNRYSGFPEAVLRGCYEAMMRRPDRTDVLKEIAVPVLFVIGEEDNVIPPEQMMQQAHLPVISHIETLKYSGHMGMWEEPHRAGEIIVKFCQGI